MEKHLVYMYCHSAPTANKTQGLFKPESIRGLLRQLVGASTNSESPGTIFLIFVLRLTRRRYISHPDKKTGPLYAIN